ncbi:MAG TPA: hypothetical protein VFT13_11615, partial [Candidatus Krumholzibacteria bacterium]|nr:hypothetical protein [Candidatus Krumholzibacteria bacterium]
MTRKPTRSALQWFGVIMLAFFAMAGAVLSFRFRAHGIAYASLGAGALLALFFYALPPLRMPLYLAWMRVFFPVGWVVS